MRRCIRDDEAAERHRRITEAALDILDGLIKLDLRIVESEIADALGVDECDELTIADDQPQDEVGMEIARFKKADPTALAEVSEQG